ncbi:hypothetical protein [Pseudomonas costantinii]|uniref:hypothetical protein n=1 Tax=Pseudomonas costantinii TaxID=168469 RepID=UPI0011145115|nr:hypothetical protein [Pseudomonas costantinii]
MSKEEIPTWFPGCDEPKTFGDARGQLADAMRIIWEIRAGMKPPVGCRYRRDDHPDRIWTYREGVAKTPWAGWEVEPLYLAIFPDEVAKP